MLTRRDFAKKGAMCSGALLAGFERVVWPMPSDDSPQRGSGDPFSGGQQLGLVDFLREGQAPTQAVLGDELDGRLYTDLASVSLQDVATATERFYIRTRVSKLLPNTKSWQVRAEGFSEKPRTLTFEYLRKAAKAAGLHLMECAGHVPLVHFGLMSGASLTGRPVAELPDHPGANAQPS